MHWRKIAGGSGLVCLAVLATLIGFSPAKAYGQSAVGKVHGSVRRESGVPVPGVWIILRNPENGMAYREDAGEGGRFEFPEVFPGVYRLGLSPDTFLIRDPLHIEVKAGDDLEVTVVVVPRGRSTGSAQPAPAEGQPSATAAGAGSQIDQSQLVGLPLNGRSYSQLATLQGSVSDPLGGSATRGGGSGSLTVSGGRSSSNTFLMDGTNIMDTGNQVPRSAAGVQLGSDAILEVQVYGVQYGAQYGRGSGGILNSITQSGTDELHGTFFEFFRNSKLDARNFFDRKQQPDDPRLPPFKRNQFGFTMTGPLVKQRTYWMGALEVMRDRQTNTDSSSIVSPEYVTDVVAEPDPRVLRYLAYYVPTTEYSGRGFGRNFTEVFQPTNETFFAARLDHRFTERDSVFVRYNFDDASSYVAQTLGAFRTHTETRQQYLTLVESHIFSPRTIGTFRAGYTRPVAARDTVADSSVTVPRELYFVAGAPIFGTLSNPGSSAFGPAPALPESDIMNSFQYAGDLLVQRGRHSLKVGGEVHRYRWDISTTANQGAIWTFSSLENFLTLEKPDPGLTAEERLKGTTSLVLALPGSDGAKAYRQTLAGFYAQDEYRVRPQLQLSLGLRYEFSTLIHDREGRTAHLADPAHDTEMQVGPLLKNNPSLRSFSPRLGVTWSPTGSAATVISAGMGLYYDQMVEYAVDSRSLSPPFYKSVSIPNLRPYDFFPDALAAAAAVKSSPTQALIMDYENFSLPRVLRYNVSIRQQLPGNWRLQGAYVGARGNHLYRAYEINQFPAAVRRGDGTWFFPPNSGPINPAFGSINLLASDAQSFYHALQLSGNKSFGRGTTVNTSYTFSKSIDDTSNFNANNEAIQYGPLRTVDRAISDYDIRNRLTVSFFYTPPVGSQGTWWKTGPLARILGGWRLGGIASVRNGIPINLRMNLRDEGFLFAARRPNLRPGREGNAKQGVTTACYDLPAGLPVGIPDRYYDPCAFEAPEAGTLGNNGRNTLKGPDAFTLDVSLQREFLLDSRRRVQFRAEAFNLTNHVNFRPFSAGSTIVFQGSSKRPRVSPTAGRFVNTNTTARQIQFALRFSF